MAKKAKLGLIGASGRMGQSFETLLQDSSDFEYYVGVSRSKVAAPKHHVAQIKNKGPLNDVDVWIDFSSPELIAEVLDLAVKNKRPLVIGTTGFIEKQKELIKKASLKIPILWSGNMSLGVQILLKALDAFQGIDGYDFQVEEIHHKRKKDAPSGTGIMIKTKLDEVVKQKTPEILSVRGGGIFGVHKVWAMSEEEVITIEHSALNRAVFARGALGAAKALLKKKPGLYSMKDVI